MIVEILKEKTWEPTWRKNQKLPAADRIRVTHRFLTPGEQRKFCYFEPVEIETDSGKVAKRSRFIQDAAGITRAIVKRIDGYSLRKGGEVVVIDTVEKLYGTEGVSNALVSEFEAYCLNADPEVQEVPLG
jgi:hypothetical protein